MVIFPNSQKTERLVSAIFTIVSSGRRVWRETNIEVELSGQQTLSTKNALMLSMDKEEIVIELSAVGK